MKEVCRLCGEVVTEFRTRHLKQKHGIEPYKGAVKDYFLTKQEAKDYEIPKSRLCKAV